MYFKRERKKSILMSQSQKLLSQGQRSTEPHLNLFNTKKAASKVKRKADKRNAHLKGLFGRRIGKSKPMDKANYRLRDKNNIQ